MLKGKWPSDCYYCSSLEISSDKNNSDRFFRNQEEWHGKDPKKILNLAKDVNTLPVYLEIALSNKCNLKCLYCSPIISSSWNEEAKNHGDFDVYSSQYKQVDINSKASLDIIKGKFFEYLPQLDGTLKILRLTGGEPLISNEFEEILENIRYHFKTGLTEISVNSNCIVPKKKVEKLVSYFNSLHENDQVERTILYCSVDTWGDHAEYLRTGFRMETFIENVEFFLKNTTHSQICFMITYNILSIEKFDQLIKYIADLRLKNKKDSSRIIINTSILREPNFLSILIGTKSMATRIEEQIVLMKGLRSQGSSLFSEQECIELQRTHDWFMKNENYPLKNSDRADFYRFVTEIDKRRGLSFTKSFPQYLEFYNICKSSNQEQPFNSSKKEKIKNRQINFLESSKKD